MRRTAAVATPILLFGVLTGCSPSAPESWSVTVDQIRAEPATPTPDTPVTVRFRVTCRRTGGSGNRPVSLVAEVRRAGAEGVVTDRVSCSVGGAAREPGVVVFAGEGRADLGKLPAGKHAVSISLQPHGGGTMPPPQTTEVTVAGGG